MSYLQTQLIFLPAVLQESAAKQRKQEEEELTAEKSALTQLLEEQECQLAAAQDRLQQQREAEFSSKMFE